MKTKELRLEDITLEDVRRSRFGCRNCLYQSAECSPVGKNFVPHIAYNEPSCKGYAYYD